MLASDLANPEFTGATNPDSLLYVEFYKKPIQNEFKSTVEGRPIFEEVDFVKINIPGDKNLVVDTPVREEHKIRFPRHWQYYEMKHKQENLQSGTPLSQWPILGPAQVEELKALKFTTVESIANSSDAMIAKIGMAGGMAPSALREKAIRYLTVAKDVAVVDQAAKQVEELKALQEKKDAEHAEQLRKMQDQIDAMVAQKPRRGRPPKTEA